MKIKWLAFIFLGVTMFSSCSFAQSNHKTSTSPQAYFDEAFSFIQSNYVDSDKVDWVNIKQGVYANIQNAKTISDTYASIREIFSLLGNKHSFFLEPEAAKSLLAGVKKTYGFAAVLVVTAAYEADRTGHNYGNSAITPDKIITPDWTLIGKDNEPIMQAAISWLQDQGCPA
jgi:C-terminal processing protease CtpA/Prc